MAYEVKTVNGSPTLVPKEMDDASGLSTFQPELLDMAYRCQNISTEELTDFLKPNELSIVHINARSLHQNYDDVISFILKQKNMIDFILISETWLDHKVAEGYAIHGYEMLHCVPDSSPTGKGCAIYIKSSIFPYCKPLTNLCHKQTEFQSLFIDVKWPNKASFVIAVVYRSPSFPLDLLMPSLEEALNTLKELNRPSFLGGDWNVDLFHYSDRDEVRNFLNCLMSYGYTPTISITSRISNTPPYTRTLIDNIFCNVPETVTSNATVTTGIADHMTIFCTSNIFNHPKSDTSTKATTSFDFKRIEELKTNVSRKLAGYLQLVDPEAAADTLVSTIQHEVAKLSVRKKPKRWTPVQPWVTPGLLRCIAKRNALLKVFLKDRTLENEAKFRKYRNVLRLTIRQSKKRHYSEQFQKHSNNPRLLWSTLREVTHTSKNVSRLPSQFDVNGTLSDNEHNIGNEFNNYFSLVGTNLDNALGPSNVDPLSYLNEIITPPVTMTFSPVTPIYIVKVVNDLKETTAGIDGISAKLLKLLIPSIHLELSHLVNLCFRKGIFPCVLKQALITPIYKSGSRTSFSNYRPISVLPVFSKIIETIMNVQLVAFLAENNILSQHQFGFRPGHSTYMPVAILHDFVTANLADKNKTASIFLDLARAFDTVNIEILLQKLTVYGIAGDAHSLLASYLNQRTQKLKYNDFISEERSVSCGVPQGSILGPLLFILYINDIHKACDNAKILLFADDTALLYAAPTIDLLQEKILESFPKICTWLHSNRLSLSIPKTFYQLYSTDESVELSIPIKDRYLKRANTIKYLGLLIDEDMKFKSHVTKITSMCRRILGISRSSFYLNRKLLLLLYNSLILPYMSYCNIIWGSNYESTLYPLITIQKRAVRLITGSRPLSHTSNLFKDLKILKLTDLVKYQILLIMHDFLFERLPDPVAKFSLREVNRPIRRAIHFNDSILSSTGTSVANYRITNYRQFVIFCRGPSLWNEVISTRIPNITDIPRSKGLFKKSVKMLFTDTY